MAGPSPPEDMSIEEILDIARKGLYVQVAALTIILWDYFTTLDLEIELIWKRKWSPVHVLYFIARYMGSMVLIHGTIYQLWLSGDVFERVCQSGGLVQMILSMISLWAMQGIIINRLWCMYRRSRLVITLLMTALFAEAASSIFVVALNFRLETAVERLNSYRKMCFPTGFDTHFYVFWIFILAFDVLIFTLAFLEAIKYIRESQARKALHQGSERSFLNSVSWPWASRHGNFVQVLLRDSIVFPFITLVSCLLNILAWFQVLPYGWLQNTLNLSAVCSPILGCRLVLNLRELYYEPFAAEFRVSNRGEVPNSPRSPIDNSFELPVVFAKSRAQQSTDMVSIS